MFSSLGKVFVYMNKYKFLVVLSLLLAGLGALLTLVGPNQVGKITDYLQAGLMGEVNMPAIAKIAIFLIIIYALSAIFSFIQHYVMSTITLKKFCVSDHTSQFSQEMPLWMPRQINVTTAPAIRTPKSADKRAFQNFILMDAATREPVQAPVTGRGMAMNRHTPQKPYF